MSRRYEKRSLITFAIENFKGELGDTPIIVEGKKDKIPLVKLGFNNILMISGQTLHNVTERISSEHKDVLILTDYDKEGKRKAEILTKLLNYKGIRTASRLRYLFRSIFKVVKIEDVSSFIIEL